MEGTLKKMLEEDVVTAKEDVVYAQYILQAQRDRERAQALARAEHLTRGVEDSFQRSIAEATAQYDRECAQLKQSMVEDIMAELKLLRDNRDGVSLIRKGLARSARSSRANVSYNDGADTNGPPASSSPRPNSTADQTSTASASSTSQYALSSTRQKPQAKSLRSNASSVPCIVAPVPAAIAQEDADEILAIAASFKTNHSSSSNGSSTKALPSQD